MLGLGRLRAAARQAKRWAKVAHLERQVKRQPILKEGGSHRLPGQLILSLTSYPPRYTKLALTIRTLLRQTIKPDRFILWVATTDVDALPEDVTRLKTAGLEVRTCVDLGPFSKFYDSRQSYPDAYIVTVDDDIAYPESLLDELLTAYRSGPPAVIAHRARRMTFTPNGPTPYDSWPLVYEGDVSSDMLMPTGVGGVLYPPGSIPDAALDADKFRALTRTNDDPWLMWMSRRAGFSSRMVARPRDWVEWNGSQKVALWTSVNTGSDGKNDGYLRALWQEYGLPLTAVGG